ncbi:MAG TPA: tyrosine--tRNA ligase, partial [Candidatus Brocadiales bacterium]|nr:tyrosine--tRNA ligase [Candidatus Brocadiales bacterium]
LEGIDGNKKMSKSLGNYIGITEEPAQIFGKAMSIKDDLMKKYFVLATDMDDGRIDELLAHSVHPRKAKAELARAIVSRYWGEEAASLAAQEFDRVFKAHELPEQNSEVTIPRSELKDGKLWMVRLLILAGFATTNSDARRLITQGGVHVGAYCDTPIPFKEVTDPKADIEVATGMILKVGRRRFAKVVVKG